MIDLFKYPTKSGKTLEVRILESLEDGRAVYEFTTREKMPAGENITLLGVFTLVDPKFFIKKFISEE